MYAAKFDLSALQYSLSSYCVSFSLYRCNWGALLPAVTLIALHMGPWASVGVGFPFGQGLPPAVRILPSKYIACDPWGPGSSQDVVTSVNWVFTFGRTKKQNLLSIFSWIGDFSGFKVRKRVMFIPSKVLGLFWLLLHFTGIWCPLLPYPSRD